MTKKDIQHCPLSSTHMYTCIQVLGHTQIRTEKEKGQGGGRDWLSQKGGSLKKN